MTSSVQYFILTAESNPNHNIRIGNAVAFVITGHGDMIFGSKEYNKIRG